jgi:hypothetical protein
LPEFEREVLTRERVEQSWDLLETKLRIQADDAAKKAQAQKSSVPVSPKVGEGTPDAPQSGGIPPLYAVGTKEALAEVSIAHEAMQLIVDEARATALSEIRRRRADEDAFILALLA